MTTQNDWVFPRGALARDGWESVVDDSRPGWQHTGLRVADLTAGVRLALPADGVERLVVPLSGSFTVRHQSSGPSETTLLEGRVSVFDGPSDVLYLSSLASATLEGEGRVAVAEAPTTEVHPSRHITRDEVPIELRGAGRSSRQVHNFGTPQSLEAGRFIVCEVITPAENWSSYPPHKHDETTEHESELEEVYYFEVAPGPSGEPGVGYHRTYSTSDRADRQIDLLVEVRDRDTVLVPHGWHGPCMAAPGNHLYYLNAMAGPADDRAWRIVDDPDLAWVRSTWADQPTDPRLPLGDAR